MVQGGWSGFNLDAQISRRHRRGFTRQVFLSTLIGFSPLLSNSSLPHAENFAEFIDDASRCYVFFFFLSSWEDALNEKQESNTKNKKKKKPVRLQWLWWFECGVSTPLPPPWLVELALVGWCVCALRAAWVSVWGDSSESGTIKPHNDPLAARPASSSPTTAEQQPNCPNSGMWML